VKKNAIWIVVTIMAIALIGLSWFQLYWMNNVIQLSRERFEKDALASMYQVAQRLERNEMAVVAANSFAFFGTTSSTEHDTAEIDYNYELIEVVDSANNHFEFKTNSNNNVKIVIRTDSSEEIHEFVNDTSFSYGEVKVTANIGNDSTIAKASIVQLKKKQKVFTKVVEEMIFHEVTQPQRVHPDLLDSLLKVEFKNHGIYLKFEFGIYDTHDKDFRIIKTSNKEKLQESTLRASLFPNDILGNPLSLMVNFPQKNQYLFNKVWASLLISVVFILMIIGAFSYVVYKIIHQKKVSDLKNDFINNMTHEFKTPIATVSLATEALQEEKVYSSRETMLRYVGVIQQESKRLGSQVEKVLQLASMEKDNLSLNMHSTSINKLAESAIERAKFQVEEKNGSLKIELLTENVEVLADETHFSNAIFNLLDNAIKYSYEAPEISLELSVINNKVDISVKDKGIGLSKDQQQHIFDKFFRVPTGNLHDVKGFGLGLNYVRYIVEAHNGEIKVESQLNKGSSFSIILPLIS
jgi:two-component system phosphate regulon sensor histidine kinase PhoR